MARTATTWQWGRTMGTRTASTIPLTASACQREPARGQCTAWKWSARNATTPRETQARGPQGKGAQGGSTRWTKPRGAGEGEWHRLNWADEQAAEAEAHGATAEQATRERQRAEAVARELAEQQAKIQEAATRRAEEEAEERRRLEQALTPEQRAKAEALHAQQAAAAAAQFGSAEASEIARQAHHKRVAEVVKAAREKDILVDQAELMQGTAEELADWAQRHI